MHLRLFIFNQFLDYEEQLDGRDGDIKGEVLYST